MVEVALYFPGDLPSTSAADQTILTDSRSINEQLTVIFGADSVSTTLSSGSIMSTSIVTSPSIVGVNVTTLSIPQLAITGNSTEIDVAGGASNDGDTSSSTMVPVVVGVMVGVVMLWLIPASTPRLLGVVWKLRQKYQAGTLRRAVPAVANPVYGSGMASLEATASFQGLSRADSFA